MLEEPAGFVRVVVLSTRTPGSISRTFQQHVNRNMVPFASSFVHIVLISVIPHQHTLTYSYSIDNVDPKVLISAIVVPQITFRSPNDDVTAAACSPPFQELLQRPGVCLLPRACPWGGSTSTGPGPSDSQKRNNGKPGFYDHVLSDAVSCRSTRVSSGLDWKGLGHDCVAAHDHMTGIARQSLKSSSS